LVVRRMILSDEAYFVIRRKIAHGELRFGQRLHVANLAEELGVSSTPVRESLNRLIVDGLAEMRPHKGIFVVSPNARDVVDLCDARMCLEPCMAKAVIENATDADIRALLESARPNASGLMGLHDRYAQIAGNPVLQRLHRQVHALLTVLYARCIDSADPESIAAHYLEEEEICRAIQAREVKTLRRLVATHMHNLQVFLLAGGAVDRESREAEPST